MKDIYNRLINHIQTNNILCTEQFGFRASLSTEKASYKLIDDILNALNNIMKVGGIFCDLQKAFDCIDHNILLTKLEFYGIRGVKMATTVSEAERSAGELTQFTQAETVSNCTNCVNG